MKDNEFNCLKLTKERTSKSTGLMTKMYQYGNFEVEVEIDTLGSLPSECRVENKKIPEISIGVCQGQEPVLNLFFATTDAAKANELAEELKDAARLMDLFQDII